MVCVEFAEVAGDENAICECFRYGGIVVLRVERNVFLWHPDHFVCEDAEFFPDGSQFVLFQLLFEFFNVDVLVVFVKEHRPVANLAEAYAFGEHVSYCMIEDEEGVECRIRKIYACALVFIEGT